MVLPIFGDGVALVGLAISLLATLAFIYLVLFPLYWQACKYPGSEAIRLAWTVGLLGLLLFLVVFSPWHAQYFQFWQGDVSRALSFLLLLLPVVGFLAFIWIHRPGTRTRA